MYTDDEQDQETKSADTTTGTSEADQVVKDPAADQEGSDTKTDTAAKNGSKKKKQVDKPSACSGF
jgi:hypothetical protein